MLLDNFTLSLPEMFTERNNFQPHFLKGEEKERGSVTMHAGCQGTPESGPGHTYTYT